MVLSNSGMFQKYSILHGLMDGIILGRLASQQRSFRIPRDMNCYRTIFISARTGNIFKHKMDTVSKNILRQSWNNSGKHQKVYGFAVLCSVISGLLVAWRQRTKTSKPVQASSSNKQTAYLATDVQKHNSHATGVWVSYKNDVFDVTEFIQHHPGGNEIELAAGGALEPFWDVYTLHKSSEILELLHTMKIGTLKDKERGKLLSANENFLKLMGYDKEPTRSKELVLLRDLPFTAETPLGKEKTDFLTPNALFYVRNHFPVPSVNTDTYNLILENGSKTCKSLSLDDLKAKFVKCELIATVQCAGNRKSVMYDYKPTLGIPCGLGLISNAKWGGVRLSEVLQYAGINEQNTKHLHFVGLDGEKQKDASGEKHYTVSIPIEMALDEKRNALLVYEMNGQDLPRDHGYPLRVIIPGVVGARSVKWLGRIKASQEESHSFWQVNDYKCFQSQDELSLKATPPIYDTPVTSAIVYPSPQTFIPFQSEQITIEGYAFSGGGNAIILVEVSVDGGGTWHLVNLREDCGTKYRSWAWTLWKITIPISKEMKSSGEIEILCRAMDSSYNVQPKSVDNIWNMRGFLNNTWHNVKLKIKVK